jgi:hypothetical protein
VETQDLPAELRRQPRQVEDVDCKPEFCEYRLGELHQPPALGHFTRAGVLATRRAVDDEDAWLRLRIVMASLSLHNSASCSQPVHRDVVVWIGKTGSGFARHRGLSRMAVGIPRGGHDCVELALQWLERRIDETAAVALFKFVARQFDRRHSLANVRLRHASILLCLCRVSTSQARPRFPGARRAYSGRHVSNSSSALTRSICP